MEISCLKYTKYKSTDLNVNLLISYKFVNRLKFDELKLFSHLTLPKKYTTRQLFYKRMLETLFFFSVGNALTKVRFSFINILTLWRYLEYSYNFWRGLS